MHAHFACSVQLLDANIHRSCDCTPPPPVLSLDHRGAKPRWSTRGRPKDRAYLHCSAHVLRHPAVGKVPGHGMESDPVRGQVCEAVVAGRGRDRPTKRHVRAAPWGIVRDALHVESTVLERRVGRVSCSTDQGVARASLSWCCVPRRWELDTCYGERVIVAASSVCGILRRNERLRFARARRSGGSAGAK